MSDLAATQRWIQDAITGGSMRAPAEVVASTDGLDARARLALYSATYDRRLVLCLRESYPGLLHVLGDELFDDFARDYLRAWPPRSYTLNDLGAAWPDHLATTRPDADDSWSDFLIDLARLERTFLEVYDGPGIEGATLAAAADLPVDADLAATFTPVPCLRLLSAGFPVGDYLVAVRRGEDPPLPAPAPSFTAVSRRDYVVTLTELGRAGHALLAALIGGATLGAAAPGAPEEAWQLVRGWAERGLIAAIDRR